MNALVTAVAVLIIVAVAIAVAVSWSRWRRLRRRDDALTQLLDDADQLESDLKECRQRLDRAHAVMARAPDVPLTGENNARRAVDAGLRSVLEHRLWIRDRAPQASLRELDAVASAMAKARAKLEPQLRALDQAQRGLEQAVRERIERDA